MVMFSEWGKIMDTATAYERAHFFGNVDYEVRLWSSTERCPLQTVNLRMVRICIGYSSERIF